LTRIAPEAPQDRTAIHALHAAAFPGDDEARLVDRLRADGDLALSLVARDDAGAVVGHVALSPMTAPFRALGLGPVAVAEDARRAGVAAALIRDGLARAATTGWQGVFVVGDAAYYGRFGFDAAAAVGFVSPYAGPHFMLLRLDPAADLPRRGAVAYAPAFAALG
jgi:putative acetyltransferase